MFIPPKNMAHIKLFTVGDGLRPYGLIEPGYKSLQRRKELEDVIMALEGDKAILRREVQQKSAVMEDWKKQYELRKTPEQIAEYQKQLRKKFIEAIGGLPERTPLNPQVTGIISRDGYRVEKVVFESRPKHHVSALLFLPDAGSIRRRLQYFSKFSTTDVLGVIGYQPTTVAPP